MLCKNLNRCLLLFASLVVHPCSDEPLLGCRQPLWIRSTLVFSGIKLTCCVFPLDCKLLERRDPVSFAYLCMLSAWLLTDAHETVASYRTIPWSWTFSFCVAQLSETKWIWAFLKLPSIMTSFQRIFCPNSGRYLTPVPPLPPLRGQMVFHMIRAPSPGKCRCGLRSSPNMSSKKPLSVVRINWSLIAIPVIVRK